MKLSNGDLIDDLYRWHKEFIRYITSLSYSNNTIELYNRAILMYIDYMHEYQDETAINEIKSIHITGFLGWLEEEAKNRGKRFINGAYLSKSTKDTYLKAIRAIFAFISDNNDDLFTFDRIFKNLKITSDTRAEDKIEYLNEFEVNQLLSVLDRGKRRDTYNSYRDSLLVKLMLFAGLRITESLGIRLCDFTQYDDSTYEISIFAKGGKNQTAYIDSRVIEDELVYFRRVANLQDDQHIIITGSGKRMTRQGAFQIVNNIYKRGGIKKDGLHLLRHTFAMRMKLRGVDIVDIKDALRHSSINTTMIYAKATKQSVINAVNEASKV